MELPVSSYVCSTISPTLENKLYCDGLLVRWPLPNSSYQRIVALKTFYCHKNGKHDIVMVDNKEAASVQKKDGLLTSIYFPNCLSFESQTDSCRWYCQRNEQEGEPCEAKLVDDPDPDDNNLCFLQWYEVLDSRCLLAIDDIDKALGCIWLRWQWWAGKSDVLSDDRVFGFVPICSLKELVHVVAKNPHISTINEESTTKKGYLNLAKKCSRWKTDRFYVNRFYVHRAVDIDENDTVYKHL